MSGEIRWSAEELLRCIPFSNQQIEDAVRRHEQSACGGGCLSAGSGREVLRLRRLAPTQPEPGVPGGGGT
jgi:hypothetical protein